MIGITSYGGYIPRLRLNRMSIYESMGWFAPAIVMVAQGERSFCNWDEDALTMAVSAASNCIRGFEKSKIDANFLASTTLPFLDRSCSTVHKTTLNLRDDILAEDFTTTLRAGTSALVSAFDAIKAGDRKQVLVTAADKREAKGAYFYEMWFGDGAASLLVGKENVIAEYLGSYSVAYDFVDHYRAAEHRFDYMWEERWTRDEGYSKIIPETVNGLFAKLDITMDDVDTFVFPCFFKAEHKKIAKKLGAAPDKVQDNLHEVCGETGTAHPFVMLVKALENAKPGERILVVGFGNGCDALYFKVTDEINKLPKRVSISNCLENKKIVDNYGKFQKFRDLVKTEMGIRAEAPTKTAMTVLWRKRKMLLGLVGTQCRECGTPQFPPMDICVNPDCRVVGGHSDYEFSERSAFVRSYTADLLAVSVDPPGMYGMIEFKEGGRFMADFTDYEVGKVFVGQPVKMAFRKRYQDADTGFCGYFWKAVPNPKAKPRKPGILFDGQVAIVTGAGAGLGRIYALELAKRGAKVVVNDLGGSRDGSGQSTSAADAVVEQIKEAGGEAVANYDSVATKEGGEAIVKTAIDAFGKVDILINNAGILRDKSFAKMTSDQWNPVRAVHLDGTYNVTRPAFINMRENGYGRIVFTTSAAGLFGNFGQTNYSSAKLALVGLMNSLKLEGERNNIFVNAVAPVAATRMTEDILPPDLQEKLKPEYVAPLVLYFCSKSCEKTGEIINAGMSHYSRAEIVTGLGAMAGDGKSVPTVEDVAANWGQIDSLEGAQGFHEMMRSLGPMIDAFNPKKTTDEKEAKTTDGGAVATIFEKMPSAFNADKAAGVEVVFQYEIAGEGGGYWYAAIANDVCKVEKGKHASPTTTILMDADDFLALMTKQANSMALYTSGKLKIKGDLMKSQLIEKLFTF